MPRRPRVAPGGLVYHALNRATARLPLFEKDADFEAFERCIEYAQQQDPTRILAYCVMPNHWHFVLWPRQDGELSAFLRRLAHTHTQPRSVSLPAPPQTPDPFLTSAHADRPISQCPIGG